MPVSKLLNILELPKYYCLLRISMAFWISQLFCPSTLFLCLLAGTFMSSSTIIHLHVFFSMLMPLRTEINYYLVLWPKRLPHHIEEPFWYNYWFNILVAVWFSSFMSRNDLSSTNNHQPGVIHYNDTQLFSLQVSVISFNLPTY